MLKNNNNNNGQLLSTGICQVWHLWSMNIITLLFTARKITPLGMATGQLMTATLAQSFIARCNATPKTGHYPKVKTVCKNFSPFFYTPPFTFLSNTTAVCVIFIAHVQCTWTGLKYG